jgi:hypothetical protein
MAPARRPHVLLNLRGTRELVKENRGVRGLRIVVRGADGVVSAATMATLLRACHGELAWDVTNLQGLEAAALLAEPFSAALRFVRRLLTKLSQPLVCAVSEEDGEPDAEGSGRQGARLQRGRHVAHAGFAFAEGNGRNVAHAGFAFAEGNGRQGARRLQRRLHSAIADGNSNGRHGARSQRGRHGALGDHVAQAEDAFADGSGCHSARSQRGRHGSRSQHGRHGDLGDHVAQAGDAFADGSSRHGARSSRGRHGALGDHVAQAGDAFADGSGRHGARVQRGRHGGPGDRVAQAGVAFADGSGATSTTLDTDGLREAEAKIKMNMSPPLEDAAAALSGDMKETRDLLRQFERRFTVLEKEWAKSSRRPSRRRRFRAGFVKLEAQREAIHRRLEELEGELVRIGSSTIELA